jgi:hypothetical protein
MQGEHQPAVADPCPFPASFLAATYTRGCRLAFNFQFMMIYFPKQVPHEVVFLFFSIIPDGKAASTIWFVTVPAIIHKQQV